jgi:hypothetical protein
MMVQVTKEAIRQEHQQFLTQLEAYAIKAISTGDWSPVLEHLNEIMAWQDGKLHEAQKQKVNAEEMDSPSVDLTQTTPIKRIVKD